MKNPVLFSLCVLVILLFQTQFLQAQTTEFTYQGSLNNGGTPATGNYDFEFALYDALSAGTQLGSTQARNGVAVANGVFSVKLDFGSQFPGANRFLEIRVRQTGGGAFTPLTPRQQLNSSPYSVKSLNADTASNATNASTATNALQLGGVAANQYVLTGDARLSDARSPLPGNGNYIQNQNKDAQPSANFHISGLGQANVFNVDTRYSFAGNHILSAPGTNNVFAGNGIRSANTGSNNSFLGFSAGNANTAGDGNSFFGSNAGVANTIGNLNSFFGVNAGDANSTAGGNAFFGANAGGANNGSENSFFGTNSGLLNVSGRKNAFFGYNAGSSSTANDNSFFGWSAGSLTHSSNNLGGNGNAFFGASAGFSNQEGAANAFFGASAGDSNNLGNLNSFFGANAGDLNTTGSNNTIIGANADVGDNNLTFATAIGAGAVVSTLNTVVLGRPLDTVQIPGDLNIVGSTVANDVTIGQPEATVVGGKLRVFSASGLNIQIRETTNNIEGIFGANSSGIIYGSMTADPVQIRTDNTTRIHIEADGRVGIGKSPVNVAFELLDVNGDIRVGHTSTSFGCVKDRNATVVAGTCSSDLRFKKNVHPFTNVLPAFSKLRPVTFDWRADEFKERHFGKLPSFGLIAQEVEAAFPDLVSTDKEGMKAVNYSKLPLLTIQAVNELQVKLEAQQKLIEKQDKTIRRQDEKLNKQQSEIDALKAHICSQSPTAAFCKPRN